MRLSKSFLKTKKDSPADEVASNAQLLIRAGYIHKEMAGIYTYLPLGKRVLDKISQVVREEMDAVGGQELQMSVLQPREIWEKTGRWSDEAVDIWFKTRLANGTELGVGLTHEEPVANALRDFISSYKDLPVYVYQIQNKFRNELRAKSGLMRGREFIMKDLYSLSRNQKEHDDFYERITGAYHRVYERLGIGDITYTTFASGGIFSKYSREFQTLSPVGEDKIYLDKERKIAINSEVYTDEAVADLKLDKGTMVEERAVEVGNIFPLGSKYTDALDVYFTDEAGQRSSIIMGCYGIGISRLMGLLAEHFADENGLVWPSAVAPFAVHLVALKGGEAQADELYAGLTEAGTEVLYDDRDESPGKKLADADLIGLPHRVLTSAKTAAKERLEYKRRGQDAPAELLTANELDEHLT